MRQQGPSFPTALEAAFDRESERYSIVSREGNKDAKVDEGRLDLHPDTYNGLPTLLLKNLAAGAAETVHIVAFTPKPRTIKLTLAPDGEDTFSVGQIPRKAIRYVGRPDLGALGLVAKVIGKHPPDYHFWMLRGDAPAFLAFEGPLYAEGPIWRVELAAPRWPNERTKAK